MMYCQDKLHHLILAFVFVVTSCQESPPTNLDVIVPPDSLQILREAVDSPEACQSCHPDHYREWQTSMHAYAMTDPVFLRLNEIGQQRSNNQLDQFCVKCHTPFGSMLQETTPGFDPTQLTALASNGIHYDVCHTINLFDRGKSITRARLDRVRHGPISDPSPNSFHQSSYDVRYSQSQICSPCHDIIAPNGLRVETTSTEWDESPYSAMGIECQNCHMPANRGKAATTGPERDNIHHHYFVGVDISLVDFPGRDNTICSARDWVTKLGESTRDF